MSLVAQAAATFNKLIAREKGHYLVHLFDLGAQFSQSSLDCTKLLHRHGHDSVECDSLPTVSVPRNIAGSPCCRYICGRL